jgi:hypothetical protein
MADHPLTGRWLPLTASHDEDETDQPIEQVHDERWRALSARATVMCSCASTCSGRSQRSGPEARNSAERKEYPS